MTTIDPGKDDHGARRDKAEPRISKVDAYFAEEAAMFSAASSSPPEGLPEQPSGGPGWSFLMHALKHAQAVTTEKSKPWEGRQDQWASIIALRGVVRFLETHRDLCSAGLIQPLQALLTALQNADQGHRPELLQPPSRSKPARTLSRYFLETNAAIAMQELMEAGQERLHASKRVARVLADVKPRSGASLSATVAGWREAAMSKVRDGDVDDGGFAQLLQEWRSAYAAGHGGNPGTPYERAQYLLDQLKHQKR